MYQERVYRSKMMDEALTTYVVKEMESDLWIMSDIKQEKLAHELLIRYRGIILGYAKENPYFLGSLKPIDSLEGAAAIIEDMHLASRKAGVGPMATVAGAISKYVALGLLEHCNEVIVENGGDLYIHSKKERIIGIDAGNSKLTDKIGIKLPKEAFPLGICTSSGTVGHSLSFGKADAVVVVSKDVVLADAMATAVGNLVTSEKDIQSALDYITEFDEIIGMLIIVADHMGIYGDLEIVPLNLTK